ncbi:MAG: hypothetical protein ABII13_02900 [Patescibacteria group bacterium]
MADWTDLSSSFGANTILTSAQQQQLRDNITAAFEKASGAPVLADEYVTSGMITDAVIMAHIAAGAITNTHIGSGQVIAGKLGADAVTSGNVADNAIVQGNIFDGAVCQSKLETDTEELSFDIAAGATHVFQFSDVAGYFFFPQTAFESNVDSGWYAHYGGDGVDGHTSYQSFVTLYQLNSALGDRYGFVKARYVTASGNIGWLFLLKEKGNDRVKGSYFSFDHPCWGRGGDPGEIPHPFMRDYVEQNHEIFCIILTRNEHKMIENENKKLSFLQNVNKNYIINVVKQTKWPSGKIPIALDSEGKHIEKKIKKPDYVIMASLKKK